MAGGGIKECYDADNDLEGLTVNQLRLDDTQAILIGQPITLTSGIVTSNSDSNIALPITLGASQEWVLDGDLNTSAPVTGPTRELTIDVNNGSDSLQDPIEAGPVTVIGANADDTGINAAANGGLTLFQPYGAVNEADGNLIHIIDSSLVWTAGGGVGPVSSTGGFVGFFNWAQEPAYPSMFPLRETSRLIPTVRSACPFTIRARPRGRLFAARRGRACESRRREPLAVDGSYIAGEYPDGYSGQCPTLSPGDIDTLITATGPITGTFAGVPTEP